MAEMKTTTLKLKRVRFKSGAQLEVLRSRKEADERWFAEAARREVEDTLRVHDCGISGFVFMLWSTDGSSTCVAKTDGRIPSIYVPDFVRNRLLAEQIERWTIKTIRGEH